MVEGVPSGDRRLSLLSSSLDLTMGGKSVSSSDVLEVAGIPFSFKSQCQVLLRDRDRDRPCSVSVSVGSPSLLPIPVVPNGESISPLLFTIVGNGLLSSSSSLDLTLTGRGRTTLNEESAVAGVPSSFNIQCQAPPRGCRFVVLVMDGCVVQRFCRSSTMKTIVPARIPRYL